MFKDKNLLVTGGTGSIGSSICNYFNNNGCKDIYSTTTNLNKVREEMSKEINQYLLEMNKYILIKFYSIY